METEKPLNPPFSAQMAQTQLVLMGLSRLLGPTAASIGGSGAKGLPLAFVQEALGRLPRRGPEEGLALVKPGDPHALPPSSGERGGLHELRVLEGAQKMVEGIVGPLPEERDNGEIRREDQKREGQGVVGARQTLLREVREAIRALAQPTIWQEQDPKPLYAALQKIAPHLNKLVEVLQQEGGFSQKHGRPIPAVRRFSFPASTRRALWKAPFSSEMAAKEHPSASQERRETAPSSAKGSAPLLDRKRGVAAERAPSPPLIGGERRLSPAPSAGAAPASATGAPKAPQESAEGRASTSTEAPRALPLLFPPSLPPLLKSVMRKGKKDPLKKGERRPFAEGQEEEAELDPDA